MYASDYAAVRVNVCDLCVCGAM